MAPRRGSAGLRALAGAALAATALQLCAPAFVPAPRAAPHAGAQRASLAFLQGAATLSPGAALAELSPEQEAQLLQDASKMGNSFVDFSEGGEGEVITAIYEDVPSEERLSATLSVMVGGAVDAFSQGDLELGFGIIGDYIGESLDKLGYAWDEGEFPWTAVLTLFFAAVLVANTGAIVGPILKEFFEEEPVKEVPPEVLRRFNELKAQRKAEDEAASLDLTLPQGRAVRAIDKVEKEEPKGDTKKQEVIRTQMLSGEVVEEKVWDVTGDPINSEQGKPKSWRSA